MGVLCFHKAQCSVTTSRSTCCGCRARDYHICFRLQNHNGTMNNDERRLL